MNFKEAIEQVEMYLKSSCNTPSCNICAAHKEALQVFIDLEKEYTELKNKTTNQRDQFIDEIVALYINGDLDFGQGMTDVKTIKEKIKSGMDTQNYWRVK